MENGADIHACNNESLILASLRLASSKGYMDMIKYLDGADIHAYNDEALRSAYNNKYQEVIEYLIEKGGVLKT